MVQLIVEVREIRTFILSYQYFDSNDIKRNILVKSSNRPCVFLTIF